MGTVIGTVIVGLILLLLIGIAVRSMYRDKKNGKHPICGGDCSTCHGACHMTPRNESETVSKHSI